MPFSLGLILRLSLAILSTPHQCPPLLPSQWERSLPQRAKACLLRDPPTVYPDPFGSPRQFLQILGLNPQWLDRTDPSISGNGGQMTL